jgi:hypothetical protein
MSSFPTINGDIVSQKPYTSNASFLHSTNDMECGVRWAYSWRVNPLTAWTVTFNAITTTEVKTLEDFFNSMCGRYGTFTFTDLLDSSVHTNCRFDQDTFEVTYQEPHKCSITLKIQEFSQ